MIERIRSWPRWVRLGLISAIVPAAITLVTLNYRVFDVLGFTVTFMFVGFFGPLPILYESLTADVQSETIILLEAVGFWFILGALIGRFIHRKDNAVKIWFGTYFLWLIILWLFFGWMFVG